MNDTSSQSPERFEALVRDNRARLWGIARTYGGTEADDVLQEILMRLWQALPRFRGESRIDTWCFRVALNTAIDWRRRKDRRVDARANSQAVDEQCHARRLDGESDEVLLSRFLGTLSDSDRACLLMYLEDIDYAGMSEVLGVSEGAARTRLSRIKSRLAEWERLDS